MSLTATCRVCRSVFPSRVSHFFGKNVQVKHMMFRGNTEKCPDCGGLADTASGEFSLMDGLIKAFTAPGMTRENVEAAKAVVTEASRGAIASDEALKSLGEISGQLAQLIETSRPQRINWELILAVIVAIYGIWTNEKSDADAQAALAEAQTQTEVAQKMLEESQAQTASLHELTTKPVSQPQGQKQTSAPRNRAERRKADALAKKGQKHLK